VLVEKGLAQDHQKTQKMKEEMRLILVVIMEVGIALRGVILLVGLVEVQHI
jgi:hypothetical protein